MSGMAYESKMATQPGVCSEPALTQVNQIPAELDLLADRLSVMDGAIGDLYSKTASITMLPGEKCHDDCPEEVLCDVAQRIKSARVRTERMIDSLQSLTRGIQL